MLVDFILNRETRCRGWVASVLVSLVLAGCGAGEESRTGGERGLTTVELPDPVLVSDAPVVCVPGVRFVEHNADGLWRWRAKARFWCAVGETGDEDLVFRFVPDGPTRRQRFNVRWNDEPVAPLSTTLGELGDEVRIPAKLLTRGIHALRFERSYRPGDAGHDNDFSEISYRVGDRVTNLDPTTAERDLYAARLLARGVTGREGDTGDRRELLSGFLLDGSRPGSFTVDAVRAGTLRVTVENGSTGSARYTLTVGDEESVTTELGEGERQTLEAPIEAGSVQAEMTVEARGEGWHLVSRPLVTGGRVEAAEAQASPPIFLITLDTTRRDALSPYGADPSVTPNLEAFAAQATVFESAYSTTSWTLPSHASMMTGLYPSRHGAGVHRLTLEPFDPTLAGLLSDAGYRTAGFPGSFVCSSRYGMSQGFAEYHDPEHNEVKGNVLTRKVLDDLDRPETTGRPPFLFLNYFDPHILYNAPRRYREKLGVDEYRSAVRGHPLWERLADNDVGAWMPIIGGRAPATPDILRFLRAAYDAEVAFMDAQLGDLFEGLKRHGLYDRALIVLVADHGELLGERGRYSHAARLDPELVEVPLLIKWPGQREAKRSDDLVSIVDLFPTILAAAGIEAPESDGLLLTPDGLATDAPARPRVFQEEHESLSHPIPPIQKVASDLYAVQDPRSQRIVWPGDQECFDRRTGDWRLVDCPEGGDELFERLKHLLGTGSTGGDAAAAVSDEDREALEALGYL